MTKDTSANPQQIQQFYIEALKDRDDISNLHVDEDNDVVFEIEDLGTLLLSIDERDPEFFALIYPNFLSESQAKEEFGADLQALFRAVDRTRRRCKAANVFLKWNKKESTWNACVSIEAFVAAADELPSRELITATFDRNLSAIHSSIHTLVQILRGDEDEEDSSADDGEETTGTAQ